jgi:hypothetical protein
MHTNHITEMTRTDYTYDEFGAVSGSTRRVEFRLRQERHDGAACERWFARREDAERAGGGWIPDIYRPDEYRGSMVWA